MSKVSSVGGTLVGRKYNNFRGVDFSSDETQVNIARSPNALNVWKDYNSSLGQAIETRVGFRILKHIEGYVNLATEYKASILKIHCFKINEKSYFLLHTSEFNGEKYLGKLYSWDNYPNEENPIFTLLTAELNNAASEGFLFNKNYYILDKKEYYRVSKTDGVLKIDNVRDIAYAPTVALVSRDGTRRDYQDYNILTGKQKCQYVGNGTKTEYILYPAFVDRTCYDVKIVVDDKEIADYTFTNYKIDKEDVLSADAYKITLKTAIRDNAVMVVSFEQAFYCHRQERRFQGDGFKLEFDLLPVYAADKNEIENLVVILKTETLPSYSLVGGKIIFVSAPLAIDAIIVRFDQEIEESKKIDKEVIRCDKVALFDNRVIFANSPKKTRFYWSALNTAEYFPATNFENAGSEEIEVSALVVMSESVALIKRGSGQNGYVFNISGVETGDGVMPKAYRATMISSSVGGYTGGNFVNDIVFISPQGLKAITRLDLHNERNIEHRSSLVDGKLVNEQRLNGSKMCVFGGYLFILVNGRIYLADSRQKYQGQSMEYEWYFWDNIGVYQDGEFNNAITIASAEGCLFFGTENGCLCKFNTDMLKVKEDGITPLGTGELISDAYADDSLQTQEGALKNVSILIPSHWTTPVDDFDFRNRFKRCNKRGAMADLKSFAHSVCKVALKTNYFQYHELKRHNGGYFDFSDFDFEDFSFNTNDKNVFYFKPKAKKWERLALKFYSDELKRPFGVFGVSVEAYVTGYAKERE